MIELYNIDMAKRHETIRMSSLRLQHGKVLNMRQELLCAFSVLTCLGVLPLTAWMKVRSLGLLEDDSLSRVSQTTSNSCIAYCRILLDRVGRIIYSHIHPEPAVTCLCGWEKLSAENRINPHYLDPPWDRAGPPVCLIVSNFKEKSEASQNGSKFLPRIKYPKSILKDGITMKHLPFRPRLPQKASERKRFEHQNKQTYNICI